MAFGSPKVVRSHALKADREILVTLQSLPDYNPRNETASVANLERLAMELDQAQKEAITTRRADTVARERLAAAKLALHNATSIAKAEVTLQYGDDSPAVHAIGRKQSSERRRPARRTKAE